jgi:hypothetical protein
MTMELARQSRRRKTLGDRRKKEADYGSPFLPNFLGKFFSLTEPPCHLSNWAPTGLPSSLVECRVHAQSALALITILLLCLTLGKAVITSQRPRITEARSFFRPQFIPFPHCPFSPAYIQMRLMVLILNSVWNPQVQTQKGPLCK